MPTTTASTYDPALGGINGTPKAQPCGVPVSRLPWSVAHKTAPCGSVVTIVPHGPKHGEHIPIVQTVVADRGPYIAGRDLDLRPDVAAALGSNGLLEVDYQIGSHRIDLHKYAQLGGDALAFQKLTGYVAGPPGKTGAGTTGLDPNAVAHDPGTLGEGSRPEGLFDKLGGFADFLGKLGVIFSGGFWLRVGMVLGGLVLLGFGIVFVGKQYTISRQFGSNLKSSAKGLAALRRNPLSGGIG